MKKTIAFILLVSTLLSLYACKKQNNDAIKVGSDASSDTGSNISQDQKNEVESSTKVTSDVVTITEKMFVTYINEIYTNTKDYIGKRIKIEGMFSSEYYEPTQSTYYYVYRTGPGCCGNDGSMCGFEFSYKGEMPKEKDWIQVIGTLSTYEEDGKTFLTLVDSSLEILYKRGAETVYQ